MSRSVEPLVIKLSCPRRFMVGDLLRHFEFTAVLQIDGDAGRTKGMIANPHFGNESPPSKTVA